MMHPGRPEDGEYAPYFQKYIDLVPTEIPITSYLESQIEKDLPWLHAIPEDKLDYRYAKNKWTIPQVLIHIVDTERVMSYRALAFARNDKHLLPGFDQNRYAIHGHGRGRKLPDILEEYMTVRASSLSLFRSFKDIQIWMRNGTASERNVSVRALAYIIAGHHAYHMNIIKDRYLGN